MPKLVLVRHGQSTWNLNEKIAGQQDIPLTDKGMGEAKAIAKPLRPMRFDVAYASRLTRADVTLTTILEELGLNIPIHRDARLNERCWGVWEGESFEALDTPEGQVIWKGWDVVPEEGESREMVYNRFVGIYNELILPDILQGKNVLVVGHHGSLKVGQMHIEGLSNDQLNNLKLPNCGAKVYEFDANGKVLSSELLTIEGEEE